MGDEMLLLSQHDAWNQEDWRLQPRTSYVSFITDLLKWFEIPFVLKATDLKCVLNKR